ncbi:MAG: EAL domain-containing protein [Clostridium sp.]
MESYDHDIAFYTEEIAKKRIHEQMIENCFEEALNDEEFLVYYQPKIDLSTEKVIGAEALVRWKKSDGTWCRQENLFLFMKKRTDEKLRIRI